MNHFQYRHILITVLSLLVCTDAVFAALRMQGMGEYLRDSPALITKADSAPVDLSRQLPLIVGLMTGFDFSNHSGTFTLTDGGVECCVVRDGNGSGVHGGVVAFVPLLDALYLSPRISLESRGGIFTGENVQTTIIDAQQKPQSATIVHEIDISMRSLALDVMLAPLLFRTPMVYACAGISVGTPLQKSYFSFERIVSPGDLEYATGLQSRAMDEGTVNNVEKLLVGVKVGAGALFQLRKMSIQLEMLYHHPLMNYTGSSPNNWRSSIVFVNIGVVRAW